MKLDIEAVRSALVRACDDHQPWLWHPCLSPVMIPTSEQPGRLDLQAVVWIAGHADEPLGEAVTDVPVPIWVPGDELLVEAGVHDLSSLGAAVVGADWPWSIALDPGSRTSGVVHEDSWAANPARCDEDEGRMSVALSTFLRAVSLAEGLLPDCHAWVSSVTKVGIPLCAPPGIFRSGSYANVPGAVFLSLDNEMQILEGLVHESAHLHLYVYEAASPLVDPAHTKLYCSPLRPDPRPLRGIILAYHALAYICALFANSLRCGLDAAGVEEELSELRGKAVEAEHVLTTNPNALTDAGRSFVTNTGDVLAYSNII